MATTEHLELANFIKCVHKNLRMDAKTYGSDIAWTKHCEKDNLLKKYASTMSLLATKHWEPNSKIGSKAASRIEWISNDCNDYFKPVTISHYREKEREVAAKIGIDLNTDRHIVNFDVKFKLLDVGSCYNPFKRYSCFEVLPIDLAPATSEVYTCDFLKVPVQTNETHVSSNEVVSLQEGGFHVVVFSLFLEYLPTPELRLDCCRKAYELLKPEGLLFIITPDSKHVGANAKHMITWRYLLSKIGFWRIKYEKLPYIHCMAFRKGLNPETSQRWATLHEFKVKFDKMYIPQDFGEADEMFSK